MTAHSRPRQLFALGALSISTLFFSASCNTPPSPVDPTKTRGTNPDFAPHAAAFWKGTPVAQFDPVTFAYVVRSTKLEVFASSRVRTFNDWNPATLSAVQDTLDSKDIDNLYKTVIEFYSLAIFQSDPVHYRKWRRERGDVPQALSDIAPPGIDDPVEWYRSWLGKAPSQDWAVGFAELVDFTWQQCRQSTDTHSIVAEWFETPYAYSFSFAVMPDNHDFIRPPLIGYHNSDWWYSGSNATMHSIYDRRAVWEKYAKRFSIPCAEFGCAVRFQDGHIRPIVLTLLLNESTRKWVPVMIVVYDIYEDGGFTTGWAF